MKRNTLALSVFIHTCRPAKSRNQRYECHLGIHWGLYLRLANVLYTFRPAGAGTLMSGIFSLSCNTVRNLHKMNFLIHFSSTSSATDVQKQK